MPSDRESSEPTPVAPPERDDVWRSTGSTGFGARLLAEFAVAFEAPKKD